MSGCCVHTGTLAESIQLVFTLLFWLQNSLWPWFSILSQIAADRAVTLEKPVDQRSMLAGSSAGLRGKARTAWRDRQWDGATGADLSDRAGLDNQPFRCPFGKGNRPKEWLVRGLQIHTTLKSKGPCAVHDPIGSLLPDLLMPTDD